VSTGGEANVKKEIKKVLTSLGFHWFMPAAGMFGKRGISDFICLSPNGVYVAIEAKDTDKSPWRPLQKEFLAEVRSRYPARGYVVHHGNLRNLKFLLEYVCSDPSSNSSTGAHAPTPLPSTATSPKPLRLAKKSASTTRSTKAHTKTG
jgi:hypothetical protein